MAGIRKRTWTTSKGVQKYCYEITYYIDDKLIRKSGFKTKQEAQNALPIITKSFSKNITIKELLYIYNIEHCPCNCKETTIELYEGYKKSFKSIYNKQAKEITGRDINKLIILWKESDYKNKTINNLLGYMKSAYNYAIENKLITTNPVTKKHTQSRKDKKVQYLTEDEIFKFEGIIQLFPQDKRIALKLALHTGLRIGELLALEWTDIDFKNKLLNVNKQYYKRKITTPKTSESNRKIDLDDVIINHLKEYKNSEKVIYRLLFAGKDGNHWDRAKFIKNYFKKAVKMLGKEDYTFHSLRHTHAAFLLSNGVDIKFVQERLGHTDSKTTLGIYDHVMPRTKNKVNDLFINFSKSEHNMSMIIAK